MGMKKNKLKSFFISVILVLITISFAYYLYTFYHQSVSELGLGTGIIVSSNGYILSNCHVTGESLSTCYITLDNGYTYEGSVVL